MNDDVQSKMQAERMSLLFANLIVQQTNLALMFLGKVPHPESGETKEDLEGARLLIDQLEMIQVKTKGNLDSKEENLLKQNLMALRLAFVEAVDRAGKSSPQPAASSGSASKESQPAQASGSDAEAAPASEGPQKRFTKKY